MSKPEFFTIELVSIDSELKNLIKRTAYIRNVDYHLLEAVFSTNICTPKQFQMLIGSSISKVSRLMNNQSSKEHINTCEAFPNNSGDITKYIVLDEKSINVIRNSLK
jgi:hypothetical protein